VWADRANLIVLWPLGGVAYVAPPQRPGATLWSIAAGPLVNVALLPVLYFLWKVLPSMTAVPDDVFRYFRAIWYVNCGLLIFNAAADLPARWRADRAFPAVVRRGARHSLLVASMLGFVGVAGLIGLGRMAAVDLDRHHGRVSFFSTAGRGLRQSLALVRAARVPRRTGYACPDCQAAPPWAPTGTVEDAISLSMRSPSRGFARTVAPITKDGPAWTAAACIRSVNGPCLLPCGRIPERAGGAACPAVRHRAFPVYFLIRPDSSCLRSRQKPCASNSNSSEVEAREHPFAQHAPRRRSLDRGV